MLPEDIRFINRLGDLIAALTPPGGIRRTSPPSLPFESAQFLQHYLKKDKTSKNNLKTLNSGVILPLAANKQRQNFCI